MLTAMNEVTQILQAIERGDRQASSQLLPLVYEELRRLAAQKLAREPAGQTLAPTALVHEAYLRLVAGGNPSEAEATSSTAECSAQSEPRENVRPSNPRWDSRGHFIAAAAEAMRRILVENARRKKSLKRGGGAAREPLEEAHLAIPEMREDLIALDEALTRLATIDAEAARLVELRYFGGLTLAQTADMLGISTRSADRLWAYARAWLHREIEK